MVGRIGGVGLICELWVQFMIYGCGFVGDVVLELDCVVVVVFFFFFCCSGLWLWLVGRWWRRWK